MIWSNLPRDRQQPKGVLEVAIPIEYNEAAGIIKEKVQEICSLIPGFQREIDWSRGATREGKDYCQYVFKNGSWFDNIAARESSRGKRRHGGLVEECVGVDGEILQTVIIPTMNVSRRCLDGTTHDEETLNKSQIYITTAGWKNSFPYDKLIQLLIWSVVKPEKSIVMGGTYKIPVLVKLLDKNFVKDLKLDGTFNEASFAREYKLLYSLNIKNCEKLLKLFIPQRRFEIKSSAKVLKNKKIGQFAAESRIGKGSTTKFPTVRWAA